MKKTVILFLIMFGCSKDSLILSKYQTQGNSLKSNPNDREMPTPATLHASFWLDGSDSTKFTSISGSPTRIQSWTTSDSLRYSLTPTTTLVAPYYGIPCFNGESIFSDKIQGLTMASNKTVFNGMHNGSPWTLYFNFKGTCGSVTPQGTILSTSLNITTNVGVWVGWYANRIRLRVSNGSGTYVFNNQNSSNWLSGGYHSGKIIFDGTKYWFYLDGVASGNFAKGASYSSANASSDPYFFQGNNLGLPAWTKNIVYFNRVLSTADQSTMDAWIANTNTQTTPQGNANVYFEFGQSNCTGRAANTQIASDLTGVLPAMIVSEYSGKTSFYNLQLGVNQTSETPATYHGAVMRFAKEMGSNTWIIQVGKGSTPIAKVSGYDWNDSTTTNEMRYFMRLSSSDALMRIEGEFNKTPILRGLIIRQGESDAVTSLVGVNQGVQWEPRWNYLLKDFIDYVTTYNGGTHLGIGWDVSKMRILIDRVKIGDVGCDVTELENIRLGQVSLGTNGFTLYPSYNSLVKGFYWIDTDNIPRNADSLHYSARGCDTLGRWNKNYFIKYVTE